MKQAPDILGTTGLKFFGEISASISHELKNALAIINESAGLLEDFTRMAPKEVAMDPEKIKTAAMRVQRQVIRADHIIKNMNRFSHSFDREQDTLDVHELLASLLALTRRLTDMEGVTVKVTPEETPVMVTTSAFFLFCLLWHAMNFAVDMLGEGKTMTISVTKQQQDVAIRLSELNNIGTIQAGSFPNQTVAALLNTLDGAVSLGSDSLLLTLPKEISGEIAPS